MVGSSKTRKELFDMLTESKLWVKPRHNPGKTKEPIVPFIEGKKKLSDIVKADATDADEIILHEEIDADAVHRMWRHDPVLSMNVTIMLQMLDQLQTHTTGTPEAQRYKKNQPSSDILIPALEDINPPVADTASSPPRRGKRAGPVASSPRKTKLETTAEDATSSRGRGRGTKSGRGRGRSSLALSLIHI